MTPGSKSNGLLGEEAPLHRFFSFIHRDFRPVGKEADALHRRKIGK